MKTGTARALHKGMQTAAATRNYARRPVRTRALVRVRGTVKQAVVVDVGVGGMRIDHVELEVDDEVMLYVASSRVVLAGVVRWTVGHRAGVEFKNLDPRGQDLVAGLCQQFPTNLP